MEGSFFTIVAKIITKLFLALVSVYTPAEKEITNTNDPITTEVIVECVLPDQLNDSIETMVLKIDESELAANITLSSGYIVLKSDKRISYIKEIYTPVIRRIVDEIPEGKANVPIIIKKV